MTESPAARECQNCKQSFAITEDDRSFYQTIKVPAPTFCPDCRAKRRMVWRCERSLYKRDCGLCGKSIISIYSPDKPYTVYCRGCYNSDKWNSKDFGQEIDWSKPFLAQLKELQLKVPRQYAYAFQNINSDYTNGTAFNKNCYLIFVSDHNEDCSYSYSIYDCSNSLDLLNCNECELSYESVTCKKCYAVYFSQDCSNSQNLYFSKNCSNCQDCVGCVNLKNARYCIFNKQYDKEEYLAKVAEMRLDTVEGLEKVGVEARKLWPNYPSKYIHGFQNVNVVGDYTFNSKNTYRTYDCEGLEDSKFINQGNKIKSVYDAYVVVDNSQYSYEVIGAIGLNNVKFCTIPWNCFDMTYSDSCENSNNLFGCVSMRKGEYCILNKQYSKEEYEALVPKLIEHMNAMPFVDAEGRQYKYGEYFPPALCPFAYNETVAQEFYPLNKQEAERFGSFWKEIEEKNYQASLSAKDLPKTIEEVEDGILEQIVGCEHAGNCKDNCTKAFKLTPAELQFYRRAKLPLPHLCHNCRHYRRLSLRNPLTLHSRSCMCTGADASDSGYSNTASHPHGNAPCANTFETTYAVDNPALVYCDQCYQTEVS